ncbi:MAG: rRNA pseudouridine synthase [Anaerolineae bacterium]|nr:rRNA pseudouridine synthase [Anaerolineae bacterium]
MPLERLQKVLAHAGIASRRACEELIRQGRVTVNGVIVTELGVKVDPERDHIRVDGERVRPSEPRRYLLVHKPAGYLSVMDDPHGRRDLGDLVESSERLFPVGRLDMASEGLILLTNDGELANHLMHPRYEHPKTYLVLVRGQPRERDLWELRRGIKLEDGHTAPARVERVAGWPRELAGDWWQNTPNEFGLTTWLRITLHEGKKRQIRRMLSTVGYPVLRLIRVGLGPLRLGKLPPGQSRPLTPYELRLLRHPLHADARARGTRRPAEGDSSACRSLPELPYRRRRRKR